MSPLQRPHGGSYGSRAEYGSGPRRHAEIPEFSEPISRKKAGRVGDSPISGSGFYVDSKVGGASATGLGEDVMKGCVAYEIVRLMKEGMHPQAACEKAVNDFDLELKQRRGKAGDMSLVAMNNKGEWGVATNIEGFSFAVATANEKPTVYLTENIDGKCVHTVASQEWLDNYMATRMAPLEEK